MERQRQWLSATFWLDVLERTVRTFIAILGAILGATTEWPQDWSTETWRVLVYGTVATFLIAVGAGFVGEPGTASVMNPAPPDTLTKPPVDAGLSVIETILIAIAVVLAVFGLVYLFG